MKGLAPALVLTLVPAATAFAQTASVDNFGGGTPGSAGVPVLAYAGAPIAGKPFALEVSSAEANSVAVIGIGLSHAPAFDPTFGATIHVGAPLFAIGILPTDAAGRTPPFLPLASVGASLAGIQFVVQALVADASATGGLAFSAGLEVRLGTSAATPSAIYPVRAWSTDTDTDVVEVVDVDGDGNLDLVTGNTAPNSFGVLLGLGDGRFANEIIHPTVGAVRDIALGDVDGDGAIDALLNTGQLFVGNGDGSFAAPSTLFGWSWTAVLADFDSDTLLDAAWQDGSDVLVALGNGDGTFAAGTVQAFKFGGAPILERDVDGDGEVDLACDFTVFRSNGDGTFAAGVSIDMGSGAVDLDFADVDGDGLLDALVARPFQSALAVRRGTGALGFAAQQQFAVAGEPQCLVARDFDGDGRADVVTGNKDTRDVSFLRGLGNGSFDTQRVFGVGADPRDLATADLDGDGALDLVAATGSVRVLFGSGDGAFGTRPSPILGGPTNALAVGDFDLDGAIDLLAAASSGFGLVVQRDVLGGAAPLVSADAGGVNARVVVGDLDGDGRLDATTCASSGPSVRVHLGNGDATFAPATSVPLGGPSTGHGLHDVDGDGALDILAFEDFASGVRVLFGNGDGSFGAPVTVPVLAAVGDAAIGDVDGDGHGDLVAIDAFTATIAVARGLGGGAFGAPQTFALLAKGDGVVLADLDGDGRDDALVRGAGIQVLLGTGAGGFAAPLQTAAALEVFALAAGDVDGDTHLDVVCTLSTSLGSDAVAVLLGNGTGGLGAVRTYLAGKWPREILPADVDGDGMLDLVVGGASDVAAVLVNRLVD
jgi:hypothetical protein